ncbi:hypothetical protein EV690_2114 [Celerinatantimonas diazotrophica]|uniref:Uncharacterized protein n=1 Tax=Celerinatantimonas diazotrophica TaxID=412034 RepID=A0A4R1JLS3_9GAMM|nr:hypothetical protein EV690_2114 [Celerinatantimonas diazotrophica]CAG9296283.1 hypothetical protein CEDIAZO_01431 [Celerinatantimonas diazotrophica]
MPLATYITKAIRIVFSLNISGEYGTMYLAPQSIQKQIKFFLASHGDDSQKYLLGADFEALFRRFSMNLNFCFY